MIIRCDDHQRNSRRRGCITRATRISRRVRFIYDRIFHWLSGVLHQFSIVVFAGGVATGIVS